jgi:hypothetical protein
MFVLVAFRVYIVSNFPDLHIKLFRLYRGCFVFFLSEWCPVKSFNNKDFNQW